MSTRELKTKLVVEGDSEFVSKFKKATAELNEQKSALKLLNEQYKNNQNSTEALSKKVEQLKNIQSEQNKVVDSAKAGLLNATKEQEKYAAQIESAKEKIDAAEAELKTLNTSTEEGAKRQEELTAEIGKYKEELELAQRNQEMASEAVDEWAIKQSKAKTNLNNTNITLTQYEQYLKEAQESTDGYATSIDATGKKVKAAADKQNDANKALKETSTAVETLASSLASSLISKTFEEIENAINECVQSAAEFETALAKVSTIADTSTVSMSDISSEITALSSETGQAVADLSEAVYNAISAGVDTASAVEFVATANELAMGGFTDTTTAVDILTTALNAYGLEVEQTSEVADYLIMTQNLGKTTVDELASSLGRVIPVASTYNVEMDNLSAAMAILTANGIATAEGTTYLKSAINELGDSGSTVSLTLTQQTGKSFSQLMQEGKSLGDVMEILSGAVNNDKGAFNELWSSSEAGVAALSILSSGADHYNEVLSEMQTNSGATKKAYEQMADTTEVAAKKLTNAFENLKIAVGTELQDQMNGAYESGTDLLNWATEFVQENEWVVPVIEAVAAALGVMAIEIAGVTVVVKVIIPLLAELNTVMAANPALLVAGAVIALTTAVTAYISATGDSTSEIEAQTSAWNDQCEALKETTAAYEEQKTANEENESDVLSMVQALEELTQQEERSKSNNAQIVAIVDQLNAKIPGLNLAYDDLTGTLNMTNEEMEKLVENQILQEKYENAVSNYTTIYEEKIQATKNLEEAQESLADAEQNLEDKTNAMNEALENNGGCMLDCGEAQLEYAYGVTEAKESVNVLTETVEGLQGAIEEADAALADAQLEIDLYTIETANMTDAQRESIDASMEEAEALKETPELYAAEIAAIAETAAAYNEEATAAQTAMDLQIQKMQELQDKYDSSYESAYNSITGQLGLFDEMQTGTSQSVDDMISAMESQVEYMDTYSENMKTAMELGVSEGILQQLSDGSEESAAILQTIVDSGEEKIQDLNEKFAEVEEGKQTFSDAIAEMETYYGEEMDLLVEDMTDAVAGMAQYDEAYESAVQTCNGIIDGVDSQWDSVIEKYLALANEVTAAYNKGVEVHSPSRKFKWSAQMTMEGIEAGIEENKTGVLSTYEDLAKSSIAAYEDEMAKIQEDGSMIAYAEQLPKTIAETYYNQKSETNNQTTNTTTQNFYISTPVKSPSELMRAARLESKFGLAGA